MDQRERRKKSKLANYTNDNFPFEIKRNLLTTGWHNQNMMENRNVDSQREFVFYAILK